MAEVRKYQRLGVGDKCGTLTVVAKAPRRNGVTYYVVRCDCGEQYECCISNFRRGSSCRKCGYVTSGLKRRTANGESQNGRLYRVWYGIKQRCYSKGDTAYRWYGKRGIRMCDEWLSYVSFAAWARSHGYEDGLSIERKNPDGNYEPENCEWISFSENSRRARLYKRVSSYPMEMFFGHC